MSRHKGCWLLVIEPVHCGSNSILKVRFYRTRVRSLAMLVTHWLPNSLTNYCLVNLMSVNDASCLMMSQQLLKAVKRLSTLEMLLMLMMRIVMATVYCMLGSWGLVIKPTFCSDFEYKVWSRFLSWSSGVWSIFCRWYFAEVMKLNLGREAEARFGRYFEF